jgi:hypothetical protein
MSLSRSVSFVFLLLLGFKSAAQDPDFRTRYNEGVITLVGDNQFMLAGKKVSRKAVKDLLLKYPESAAEYRLFQKKKKISNALLISSAGLYVVSIGLLNDNVEAGVGTFATAFLVSLTATPFQIKAHHHLLRSVFLYNREMLAAAR